MKGVIMKKRYLTLQMFVLVVCGCILVCKTAMASPSQINSGTVITLDGPDWLLATDAENIGKEQKWWTEPRATSKPTKVRYVEIWRREDIGPIEFLHPLQFKDNYYWDIEREELNRIRKTIGFKTFSILS